MAWINSFPMDGSRWRPLNIARGHQWTGRPNQSASRLQQGMEVSSFGHTALPCSGLADKLEKGKGGIRIGLQSRVFEPPLTSLSPTLQEALLLAKPFFQNLTYKGIIYHLAGEIASSGKKTLLFKPPYKGAMKKSMKWHRALFSPLQVFYGTNILIFQQDIGMTTMP